jgi:hypothetical protein
MRIKTWRLSVVLILVAASLVLAVPGVAGAHVRAQYRAEYKRTLKDLSAGFGAFASNYDNMKQGSIDAAATMAPMINDPNQRESLVDHENWCLNIYNMNKGKPYTWSVAWGKSINAFSGKAKRYFATGAQQRKFKDACLGFKANSAVLIWQANDFLYRSYQLLGMDPPAIDLAAEAIAAGDERAASGHEGVDKWTAALRALL